MKSKILLDQDYSWENSSDIEGDVNWVVDTLVDEHEYGEFPGTLRVVVEYVEDDQ